MKKLFLLFLLMCFAAGLAAEEALQICRFPDGKKAMLALTFDDILDDQCKYAPAILEKYGFKATFFMIPDRIGRKGRAKYASLDDILLLAEAGHEIGNHSTNHSSILAHLEKQDYEALERVVIGGQDRIEELTGTRPLSFCYPGNRRSAETDEWVLKSHLAVTTRTRKLHKTPEKVRSQMNQLIRKGTFGDTMIHGIIEGYDPYASVEDFEACIAEVKKFEKDIAIGTMLETGCYAKRRDGAALTVLEKSGNKTVYRLELSPEYARYKGTLSLSLTDAGRCRIKLNDSKEPLTPVMQGGTGIFQAETGDTVTVEKR